MGDDTMKFISDLRSETKNKMLKKLLKCIELSSPSDDFAYGDWNDRQEFMENEYDSLVKETVNELERIVKNDK